MTARPTHLMLAASLALAPALLAQDRAVPRGGGGGGSSGGGGGHPSPGVSSSGGGSSSGDSGGSSSGSGSSSTPSTAQRRHPRAGTGRGSSGGGGYYPGYPGYPGYWGGGYYPGYWGSWWPYGSFGWYGGYYGYPWGWGGGGSVYHYVEHESGSVRVLVDPAETRVYVDGYYTGTVDDFDGLFQRLRVSPGRHEIALKLEGYKTHRVRVYVAPESTLKLHYDLEKGQGESFEDLAKDVRESEPRRERESEDRWSEREERAEKDDLAAVGGHLELTVRPEDASVYVDGAFRGSAREASTLRLPPGRHRIEIVRPGFKTHEQQVEIVPGETTELEIDMERPSV
jgi:PEGA domain